MVRYRQENVVWAFVVSRHPEVGIGAFELILFVGENCRVDGKVLLTSFQNMFRNYPGTLDLRVRRVWLQAANK